MCRVNNSLRRRQKGFPIGQIFILILYWNTRTLWKTNTSHCYRSTRMWIAMLLHKTQLLENIKSTLANIEARGFKHGIRMIQGPKNYKYNTSVPKTSVCVVEKEVGYMKREADMWWRGNGKAETVRPSDRAASKDNLHIDSCHLRQGFQRVQGSQGRLTRSDGK